MKLHQIPFLALFFLATTSCYGQLEKTFHQTFEVSDRKAIQLNLYGQYQLIPWAGNNVLIETKISLYNSTSSVLQHFVEKEHRYQVDMDSSSTEALSLYSHDLKRAAIRNKLGVESTEVVETKVFYPENFTAIDEKHLVLEIKND